MAIDWDAYLATLPAARRQAIKARAQELIAEELSLAELRKDLKQSQAGMAKKMGIRQGDVSKIEHRSDMLVSTLRSYVEATGSTLVILIEAPGKPPRRLAFNEKRNAKIKRPPSGRVTVVGPRAAMIGSKTDGTPKATAMAKKAVSAKEAAAKKATPGVAAKRASGSPPMPAIRTKAKKSGVS